MKKQRVEKERISKEDRQQAFARALLHWNRYDNGRQMPWKGEKDPYRIWLSEVILQQTRVEQGLKYYNAFVAAFPNVQALAEAADEKVFKLWEGLGYYSRCRNLLAAARYIVSEHNGVFPSTYEGILALKGVGSYTAAAIASFAYNLPYAVVDGNVFRVLARIFDIDTPIDSTAGKKQFAQLAQEILPAATAGNYNQAIMDFGATLCKPAPLCEDCFFTHHCLAYRHGRQLLLPVKEKKPLLKKRWLSYFIVQCGDQVLIQQRTEKDIWHHLHQFFLVETEKGYPVKKLEDFFQHQSGIADYTVLDHWTAKQLLSHQSLSFSFFYLRVAKRKAVAGYRWVSVAGLTGLAFPRSLQQAVQHLSASGGPGGSGRLFTG